MTTIEKWLTGSRDYNEGVVLYMQYGNNLNLKRVFSHGPNDYNIEKLAYELENIKHLGEPVVKKREVIDSGPPKHYAPPPPPDRSQYIVTEKPQKYHELHKEWRMFYKQASHLHQTMLGMDQHKNDRGKAAERIIEIFEKEISPRWEQLDYFEANGSFNEEPVKEAVQYTTIPDMIKRRNNLRIYITKYQDKAGKQTQLELWRKEMEELNNRINAIQQ